MILEPGGNPIAGSWVRLPQNAPELPYAHSFGSRLYAQPEDTFGIVGETGTGHISWYNGSPNRTLTLNNFCGDPLLLTGQILNPPYLTAEQQYACCSSSSSSYSSSSYSSSSSSSSNTGPFQCGDCMTTPPCMTFTMAGVETSCGLLFNGTFCGKQVGSCEWQFFYVLYPTVIQFTMTGPYIFVYSTTEALNAIYYQIGDFNCNGPTVYGLQTVYYCSGWPATITVYPSTCCLSSSSSSLSSSNSSSSSSSSTSFSSSSSSSSTSFSSSSSSSSSSRSSSSSSSFSSSSSSSSISLSSSSSSSSAIIASSSSSSSHSQSSSSSSISSSSSSKSSSSSSSSSKSSSSSSSSKSSSSSSSSSKSSSSSSSYSSSDSLRACETSSVSLPTTMHLTCAGVTGPDMCVGLNGTFTLVYNPTYDTCAWTSIELNSGGYAYWVLNPQSGGLIELYDIKNDGATDTYWYNAGWDGTLPVTVSNPDVSICTGLPYSIVITT